MNKLFYLFLIVFIPLRFDAQTDFNGVWQGIMIKDGYKNEQASILFAEFKSTKGSVEGKTRDEIIDTDQYAVKKIKGTCKNNEIKFNQFVIEKKKNSSKTNWCNIDADLFYNDSTGYLEGRYTSTDCKRNTGKIILYRSKASLSASDTPTLSHSWFKPFLNDLKKGYNAPMIRDVERKNFQFQPIYFDHDKAEIKPEYIDFLIKMTRVVDGHTDLRIKVTGHTDADGSDAYNVELSKRRAQALIDFFVAHGLSKDRIEIDFKGESAPIDSNSTPEGKQHNRRVDFAFI
jgi:outer membrane protein OmpA-like peptidoglycan-associated protein